MEKDEGYEYYAPGNKAYLSHNVWDDEADIPPDAWAFRLRQWYASTGEELLGRWHRTKHWVRRGGTYSGLTTWCGRVYNAEDMELVGTPDHHPLGSLCFDCFGINHSDDVTR